MSGVWKSTQPNEYGIQKIIVSFDGKAEFVTGKLQNASWHCFWGASARQAANLNCTSSINTDQKESFIFTINEQGLAELHHNQKKVGIFSAQNENPQL